MAINTEFGTIFSNEKMRAVEFTILKTMKKSFPADFLDYVFAWNMDPADIVEQVMLDCVKEAYDEKAEKHPVQYFLKKYGLVKDNPAGDKWIEDENNRVNMHYSRLLAFVMEHRKDEYDRRVSSEDELYGMIDDEKMNKLLPPNMNDPKNKYVGYQLTEMNFYEIMTMDRLEFVKALTERRLMNTNSINNTRFQEIMAAYDAVLLELESRYARTDEDTVFSSIAAYTLEWKYAVDFLYAIATEMDESHVREIPDMKRRLVAYCGDVNGQTRLGFGFSTHSRMVTIRDRYIKLLVNADKDDELYEQEQDAFVNALGLVAQLSERMTIDDVPIRKWFIENTDMEDWASFFGDYNLFNFLHPADRKWNNKKMRYVRQMYDAIIIRKEPKGNQ